MTSGFISWGESDFNWINTNNLPTRLKGKLKDEPVFVNVGPETAYKNNSDFKSVLLAGCTKIVARINGKEPREIESEESIRKRNIIGALSVSVVVLITALVFNLLLFFDAKEQANRTQGLYLTSESDKLIPVRAIQLLLSAWEKNKSDVVRGDLLSVFNNESILSHDIDGEIYAISPLYSKVLILNDSNTVELRDYQGRKVSEAKHNKWITRGQFHPIQQLFLTCSSDSTAKVWRFGAKCRHNTAQGTGFGSTEFK